MSRRWMVFVDGENLTIRAQRIAEKEGITLGEGPAYKQDVFIWKRPWKDTNPQGDCTET